jgi:hypothetical protein
LRSQQIGSTLLTAAQIDGMARGAGCLVQSLSLHKYRRLCQLPLLLREIRPPPLTGPALSLSDRFLSAGTRSGRTCRRLHLSCERSWQDDQRRAQKLE